jgi:cytochrome c5
MATKPAQQGHSKGGRHAIRQAIGRDLGDGLVRAAAGVMTGSIRRPLCAACHAETVPTMMIPRDDGGAEWHFRCTICKTDLTATEEASPGNRATE